MVTGSVIHNIDLHHSPLLAAMSKPPGDLAESAGGTQSLQNHFHFVFGPRETPYLLTLLCVQRCST